MNNQNISPRVLGISAARKYGKTVKAFDLSLIVESWPLMVGDSEEVSYLNTPNCQSFLDLVFVLNAQDFSAFTIVFETGTGNKRRRSVKTLTAAQISDKRKNCGR